MIETPTVLVLGAGSSWEYGYPATDQLLVDVANRRNLPQDFKHGQLKALGDALIRSVKSVDVFLEFNPDYMELGKFMIAANLMRHESPDLFRADRSYEDHGTKKIVREPWYRYLWDRLFEGTSEPSDLEKNRVKIITFNYDRSLEFAIATYIQNSYSSVQFFEDAWKIMTQSLPIVHVYGDLGPPAHLGGRDYEPLINSDASIRSHIVAAAKGIHIMSDERETPELATARTWLVAPDVSDVYFLGFGFDRRNIDRLGIENFKGKNINATVYGMSDEKITNLGKKFGFQLSTHARHNDYFVHQYPSLESILISGKFWRRRVLNALNELNAFES